MAPYNQHQRTAATLALVILLALLAVSCRPSAAPSPTPPAAPHPTATASATVTPISPTASATKTQTATAVPSPVPPTPTPTATVALLRVAAVAAVPAAVVAQAQEIVQAQPQHFTWSDTPAQADLVLAIGEGAPLAEWIYAPAAPFATVADSIDLAAAYGGGSQASGTFLLDKETAVTLAAHWGEPAATVVPAAQLVTTLQQAAPSWTILPFHQLQPALKVLRVGGVSPLDSTFEAASYPLAISVGVVGTETAVAQWLAQWPQRLTNRDPQRITRIAMTGPSGLSRAVADRMERLGITHPGKAVAPILQTADFAHLSNEIPFAPDCPESEQEPYGDIRFCARPAYLQLMTYVGTDINEMTGNHVNDWGEHNLHFTLDLYREAGIETFGGGRNLAQAQRPLLIEHNGNKVAFVGCNTEGPYYAWAREDYGGALPCGDFSFMRRQIGQLRAGGYLVIATLQYLEHYQYGPTWQQQRDFRALAEAGATAVSGSQGHHAQGFDFHAGAFIHYGLGNLFFDQMDYLGTRQTFIDTYVIYDGRLLSVTLWTGLIENYCCPRPTTAAERAQLLEAVFTAGNR